MAKRLLLDFNTVSNDQKNSFLNLVDIFSLDKKLNSSNKD